MEIKCIIPPLIDVLDTPRSINPGNLYALRKAQTTHS